jgi:N utilization substance protein A
MVVSELRGEKIDIIPFNEEPARFVAKALSPARVREVLVDDEAKQATVIVPDDQLSLAIGKDGLNARLAARLTGWRVDIRSETEFAEDESEMGYAEEDVSGRCACILANGKRCPNASLPGSRYCGLPAHQALEGTGTDYLVPPEEGASDNGDLPIEDLIEEDPAAEVPLEESVAESAVEDDGAATASADQPTDEEPEPDAEPVPEDPPADPEGEAPVDPDDPELDEEPEADTATPDESAADEEAETS